MAHRLLRDHEADGWERSDFPIICESCLGDSPYVRMTRAEYDKECKICTRPFTVFRWRPGRDARYKKTEICQTCSKLKNVCQVCLLDLEYGLPVQVRDTALHIDSNDAIPKSDVNREYFAEEHDRKARAGIDYESSFGKARPNDTILKLQRTTPYYKRNRAHICSFYIRGECTRGAECPYRHEMPETGELSQQNIKDRYYGVNDPVALKLLGKAGEMATLEAPEDESIKTLYVGGLDARVTEQDLRDNFYAHGEIESIKMVLQRACAFVSYTTREGAEKAAEELSNKLVIKGLRLKLMWGRPQTSKPESDGSDQARQQSSVAHSGLLPRAVISQQQNQDQTQGTLFYNNPPPMQQERSYYPSMDPQRMGALISSQDGPPGGPSGSGENKSSLEKQPMQHYARPMMPPPPGQYHHQYYSPYGYMPPVPPYQQYPPPPYNTAAPSQPPAANHPYQHSTQPVSSQTGSVQAAHAPTESGTSTHISTSLSSTATATVTATATASVISMATVTTQASAAIFRPCASKSRFLTGSSGKLNREVSMRPMGCPPSASFKVEAKKGEWLPGLASPTYLNGSLPGDNGFDPLGLAEDPENLRWYVQAELVNGRWAMLGVAGMLLPEVFTKLGIINAPQWYDAGKAEYFASSSTLFVIEFILFHYVEIRRWQDIKNPGSVNQDPIFKQYSLPQHECGYPGSVFNPLNFAPTLEAKEKELANGRLAMLAFLGFIIQHNVTGKGPFDNLLQHLSDPWHNTIINTIRGY